MQFEQIPKVLIIDDQESNRLMIKLTLKQTAEYHFLEAADGKEGITLAFKELPHIILIDAMMPNMNGFEAIKILRNNPLTINTPILMISSLSNDDRNVQALKSGISDFISKPFNKTELITRVNSLLHLYLMFSKTKQELQEMNKDLEQKVQVHVQRKLEDIRLASVGKMTAAITHELNTPIAYMKSNFELMQYDLEDIQNNEELKESLFETHNILSLGLERLQKTIDNTMSVLKKGDNLIRKENLYSTLVFSSRIIYNRSKYLMPIYINDKLFDLDFDENSELFESNIVKEKIEQVWIIILNNACDEFENSKKEFTDRKMQISIIKVNDKIKIIFKDNATYGIPEDLIPNIFDPFTSTKIGKGMGVGLNIAKEIVEELYGTIKAYNEDSCAIFEIELES